MAEDMGDRLCRHCGQHIGEWRRFCPKCGQSLRRLGRSTGTKSPAQRIVDQDRGALTCSLCEGLVGGRDAYCRHCGAALPAGRVRKSIAEGESYVVVGAAQYVGGGSASGAMRTSGRLCLTSEWIGFSERHGQGADPTCALPISAVERVEVVHGQYAEKFVPIALLPPLVVFHKRQPDRCFVVVYTKTQGVACFQVNMNYLKVRELLDPLLRRLGVPVRLMSKELIAGPLAD